MYRIHRAVHWAPLDAYIRSLGPAAWFRMDQGVTVTGAGISQIDDLSGNARHLLDPGTTRPIYLPFSGTRYLYLPGVAGNYASTPDSVANSITGDIDIRVRVAASDWTPSAAMMLASKYAAGQISWYLQIGSSGILNFQYTSDGSTTAGRLAASSAATGISDGADKWVRVTYATATGKVNFYTSSDGATWAALGVEQTITSGAIHDGTAPVEVGSFAGGGSQTLAGKLYRAIIKNGIDGTTVVDFNPADADGDGDTSFASSTTGETWTINSSGGLPAQIVGRAAILFNGTSHYLKTAAFTLNQPEWVLWVGKQVSWTNFDNVFDGNAAGSGALIQNPTSPNIRLTADVTVSLTNQNGGLSVGVVGVVSSVFNGTSSYTRVNNGSNTTGDAGAGNMGGLTLASRGSPFGGLSNISTSELIVFPFAPTAEQQSRIIAGLMARHGVA